MVFNIQGQKTGVKGFTYELSGGSGIKAGFFQAGVKENANVWVKQYTSPAAFNAADAKFGSAGQVGGPGVRTQSPNSGSGNSDKNEYFAAHQIPDGTRASDISFNDFSGGNHGLAFSGNIWAVHPSSSTIYETDKNGVTLNSFSTPGASAQGTAWDGEYIWVADNNSNVLYQLDSSNGSEVTNFGLPFGPQGLEFDGSYLYTSKGDVGVYRLNTDGTNLTRIFNTGNIWGIANDGKYLYIGDRGNALMRQITKSGTEVNNFSTGANVTGCTWDGDYLLQTFNTQSIAYQITGSASLDLSYQVSGFTIGGILTLNNTETLGVNETKDFQQELFRTYDASISTDETRQSRVNKALNETVATDDLYSRTVDYFRNLSDGIGLTANQDNNFGVLSGIVYKDSTSNPANNAYVFVLEKSTQEFVGAYVTKSSGRYSVPSLKEGEEYLVGVDWFDPSNNTFYGEEKSINFTDTD